MRRAFRLIAPAFALLIAGPAEAALAPEYQRLAELQRILETPAVLSAFAGVPIDNIAFVRPDLYRVSAGRCQLEVAIVDLPMPAGIVGARRFAVRPGRRSCRR